MPLLFACNIQNRMVSLKKNNNNSLTMTVRTIVPASLTGSRIVMLPVSVSI